MSAKNNVKNTINNSDSTLKGKNSSEKNITGSSEDNVQNGYVGGDRTRSSSSHQFHKESD